MDHFNESTSISSPNNPNIILSTLQFTGCSIGLITDALMIYTIFANKALRTRTNRFVAAWAICDFLSTTSEPTIHSFTPNHQKLECVFTQTGFLFPSCCLLIMLFMIWNISINATAIFIACLAVGVTAFNITTCVVEFDVMYITYKISESAIFVLLITCCVNNIILYVQNRSKLLSQEEYYRHGLFRLGYRLWILSLVLYYFLNNLNFVELLVYVNIFVTLIPVVMFWYLMLWNDAFKHAVCNLCSKQNHYESHDGLATTRHIDDVSWE